MLDKGRRLGRGAFFRVPLLGMSLIEVVLLLGIVGFFVSGLFNMLVPVDAIVNVKRATKELEAIVGNIKGLYVGRPLPVSSGCTRSLPPTREAGVYPSSMLNEEETRVNNPWNRDSDQSTVAVFICGRTAEEPARILIRYSALPHQGCFDLVLRTAEFQKEMPLLKMKVNKGEVNLSSKRPEKQAKELCSPDGGEIEWYYRLGG